MSRTKKRTKKTPQQRRKSTRDRKRSAKGQQYDEDIRNSSDSTENAGASNVNNENYAQPTPTTINVETPRRKSPRRRSEGTDLNTLLTVSDVVEKMVEQAETIDFPASVVEVDPGIVKEISFSRSGSKQEGRADDEKVEKVNADYHSWIALGNMYELIHYHHNTKYSEADTAELEMAINEHVNTINSLLHDNNEKDIQLENLAKNLFLKDQQLKKMTERAQQLQDSNTYRKEVVRLEGVVEQGELEVRSLKEELQAKFKKIQSLEAKQQNTDELRESIEKKKERIEELEEKELEREENLKGLKEKINHLEKIEEEVLKKEELLNQNSNMMEELEGELKSRLEVIKILEENKSFLMNENATLKNEVKLLKQQQKYPEEKQVNTVHVDETTCLEDQNKLREELYSLKGELRRFKQYTFKKFDSIAGRSCTLSSGTSSDDSVSSKGSEPREKKATPPRRKQWRDVKKNPDVRPPWVLRYENNGPQTVEASPDEDGRTVRVEPNSGACTDMYRSSSAPPVGGEEEKIQKIKNLRARREARESKTLIFSSRITRNITRHYRSFTDDCKTK